MDTLLTIFALTAMFGLVYVAVRFSRMRSHERLDCPEKKVPAEVDLDVKLTASWGPGAPADVLSCSLLEHPERIDCAKACLHAHPAH